MHREVLGSIWKIGRYHIKVLDVLSSDIVDQMKSLAVGPMMPNIEYWLGK